MEGDVARLAGMQMRLRLSRLISATLIVSAATLAWVHLTGADGRYFPLFTGAWTTMSTFWGLLLLRTVRGKRRRQPRFR